MARQNDSDRARSHGSRPQLAGALATGVREMPRNASWLVAKALKPLAAPRDKVKDAGEDAVQKVRSTGAVVKDALPGTGDSVEHRLARAHAAADQAKQSEEQSVASAREADRLAKAADRAETEKEKRIEEVRSQQQAEADARVHEAEQEAERRVAEVRAEAQARADHAVARFAEQAESETERVRREAVEARERAEQDFARATEQLAEARRRSDEATQAAQEAASEAAREADRLTGAARTRKKEAASSVAAARRVQTRNSTAARKKVSATTSKKGSGSASAKLEALPKKELLELATAQGVEGRSSMTKTQLARALR